MASAGARAYNGGVGALPPAGSRDEAPLKLKTIFVDTRQTCIQLVSFFSISQVSACFNFWSHMSLNQHYIRMYQRL